MKLFLRRTLVHHNILRHCEAAEAISSSLFNNVLETGEQIASFLAMAGKVPNVQECDATKLQNESTVGLTKK